jgi:hypothetical protein
MAPRLSARFYVDANVVVTLSTIRTLVGRLEQDIAVSAAIVFRSDWMLVAGTRGLRRYVLSEVAQRRFGDSTKLVADDTYVRIQFRPDERETVASARSIVALVLDQSQFALSPQRATLTSSVS